MKRNLAAYLLVTFLILAFFAGIADVSVAVAAAGESVSGAGLRSDAESLAQIRTFLRDLLAQYEEGGHEAVSSAVETDEYHQLIAQANEFPIVYLDASGEYGIGAYLSGNFIYVGGYMDSQRSGYGSWIRVVSTPQDRHFRYEGEWADDSPNGPGKTFMRLHDDSVEMRNDAIQTVSIDWEGTFQNGYYNGAFSETHHTKNGVIHIFSPFFESGIAQIIGYNPSGNPYVATCTDCGAQLNYSGNASRVSGISDSPTSGGVFLSDSTDLSGGGSQMMPTIPNAHPGPSPYSIIPDTARGSDGFIGAWNPHTGRYEITGLPEDVADQIMFINAPFGLFDSFWIDGVIRERNVHYTVEEGSTRVTVMAQTITDLDNGDHTAVAAFSRDDGSELLDVVSQEFTVNLTRTANIVGSGISNAGASASAVEADTPELQAALTTQNAPSKNVNPMPIIIGAAVVVLMGGGVFVFLKKRQLGIKKDSFSNDHSEPPQE